ncbi:MAG: hypothetical protein P8X42_11285, partial [Calditrichaceae bacterium]
KSLVFDFAVQFHNEHPKWRPDADLPDSILTKFKAYIKRNDFEYEVEGGRELNKLEEIAEKKNYSEDIVSLISSLKEKMDDQKEIAFQRHEDEISKFLYMELVEKYLGNKERDSLLLQSDDQVTEAVKVLQNDVRYSKILAVN